MAIIHFVKEEVEDNPEDKVPGEYIIVLFKGPTAPVRKKEYGDSFYTWTFLPGTEDSRYCDQVTHYSDSSWEAFRKGIESSLGWCLFQNEGTFYKLGADELIEKVASTMHNARMDELYRLDIELKPVYSFEKVETE